MRRAILGLSVLGAAWLAGCASTPEPKPADLSALEPVGEFGVSVKGPWTPMGTGMANIVPEDMPLEEGQVRDGSGVSTALLKGFTARDLALEATVVFDGGGAPSLVFRAQEKDGTITDMYAVALYANGLNFWRMLQGRWVMIEARTLPIAPRTPYALRVEARGDRFVTYINGERVSEIQDQSLTSEGRAGIRAVEGPCRFSNLRVVEL